MKKESILSLFNDDIKAKQAAITEFVMNKENSREDRLEVWTACPSHMAPEQSWVVHLPVYEKKYGEISWYDDFYVERGSIFDLRDVIDYAADHEWTEEQLNDFINECMDLSYFKFCMDW